MKWQPSKAPEYPAGNNPPARLNGVHGLADLFTQTVSALRFFTRLPIPAGRFAVSDGHDLAGSVTAFPIAGAVIGTLIALFWWAASLLLPSILAAGLAIGFSLLLTGALHEDGFADCADGLGGGHMKERALEIMRDSRIGAYGAAALFMTLALRWAALSTLAPVPGVVALVITHTVSRSAITIALANGNYARKQGLGISVSGGVEKGRFWLITAIALLIGLGLGGVAGLCAAILAYGASWGFFLWLKQKLGGYTGDGLGAMQQIAEITVLVVLAGFSA
jgi:adenosylcobinamide-GDP ribazoletransferase